MSWVNDPYALARMGTAAASLVNAGSGAFKAYNSGFAAPRTTYNPRGGYGFTQKRSRGSGPVGGGKIRRTGRTRTVGYYGRFSGASHPNQELKYMDQEIDIDPITSAFTDPTIPTTAGTLVVIPQNTSQSGRIGRYSRIVSIAWSYTLTLKPQDVAVAPNVGPLSNIVRIVLFVDTQANALAPVATDLFQNAATFDSFRNLDNSTRFMVLMDRRITLDVKGVGGGANATKCNSGSTLHNGNFFKKINIPIEYAGATGAIGEIKSNNISCFIAAHTTAISSFKSHMRIRYTDG